MKTLAVLLCFLIVMLPVNAQQVESRPAPRLYVPYGVRDLPALPEAYSSSIEGEYGNEWAAQRPMPRPYPVRRGGYYRPAFGGYRDPGLSTAGAVVFLGMVVMVVTICAVRRPCGN